MFKDIVWYHDGIEIGPDELSCKPGDPVMAERIIAVAMKKTVGNRSAEMPDIFERLLVGNLYRGICVGHNIVHAVELQSQFTERFYDQ